MTSILCALGHVATAAELERAGVDKRGRAALLVAAYQPRRGTYACAHLPPLDRMAVACRARVDCVTALRTEGIWTGHHRGLHLRAGRGDHHARERIARIGRPVSVHWQAVRFPSEIRTRVSIPEALLCAARCLPPDDLVAAIESAVHLKVIDPAAAKAVIAAAPRRLRKVLTDVDPGFRAQSGYETHVRLRLRRRGHYVEPQSYVSGVGHLDNLVDGLVAVETDGSQHRDSLEQDHLRDLGTERRGIRVLRIDPGLVDRRWDDVYAVIERMLRDARAAQDAAADTDSGARRRKRAR